MGAQGLLAPLSVLLCLCVASSLVVCRGTAAGRRAASSAFLDVSGSIQRTRDVLSLDHPEITTPAASSSQSLLKNATAAAGSTATGVFSLELHPRAALGKVSSRHKDYRSLLRTRLARDAARVSAISARIDLAVAGFRHSDLRPKDDASNVLLPEEIQTPVVSGVSHGSGEYFARLGFGSPPKQMYVVPDTGSDVNWIQCQPCGATTCYSQSDPIFDPRASSSYKRLGCGAPQCDALEVRSCRSGGCLYQVSYGDGSFTVGDFATETLSFGSSGSIPSVAVGCGHDNEGLFVGAAGLLGLGGGPLSLTSQLKATSLSYCFVDRDSAASSTLDFNSARPADSVTAPLLRNRAVKTFFYVGLSGLSVGGRPLSLPASLFQMDASGRGGIIVDSGTAVTRLPTQAYAALRDAFRAGTRNLRLASGVSLFDTCYDFSSLSSVRVPTVSFLFGAGKEFHLPASNYLVPVDSSGTFCLAFAPTSSSPAIIGNIQQQGARVSYSLSDMLVGFSPNKC